MDPQFINLFYFNFTFKYQDKSLVRNTIGLVLSIMIYIFAILITITYIKDWIDSNTYTYSAYKTNNNKFKNSDHNISLSDLPFFLQFKYYDNNNTLLYNS